MAENAQDDVDRALDAFGAAPVRYLNFNNFKRIITRNRAAAREAAEARGVRKLGTTAEMSLEPTDAKPQHPGDVVEPPPEPAATLEPIEPVAAGSGGAVVTEAAPPPPKAEEAAPRAPEPLLLEPPIPSTPPADVAAQSAGAPEPTAPVLAPPPAAAAPTPIPTPPAVEIAAEPTFRRASTAAPPAAAPGAPIVPLPATAAWEVPRNRASATVAAASAAASDRNSAANLFRLLDARVAATAPGTNDAAPFEQGSTVAWRPALSFGLAQQQPRPTPATASERPARPILGSATNTPAADVPASNDLFRRI